MFANEILKQDKPNVSNPLINIEEYGKMWDMLKRIICKSDKFHIKSGDKLLRMFMKPSPEDEKMYVDYKDLFKGDWGEMLRCPYPNFYLDYNLYQNPKLESGLFASPKRAIIVTENPENHNLINLFIFSYIAQRRFWILSPVSYGVSFGTPWEDIHKHLKPFIPYEHGVIMPITLMLKDVSSEEDIDLKSKIIAQTISEDFVDLGILNAFLMFLSCKNSEVQTINTPRSIRKRKRKKKKSILPTYNVIKIKPMKTRNISESNTDSNKEKNKYTFRGRMGHFRTYTKERPLFGNPKLYGRFFFSPSIGESKEYII